eukprot:m.247823 g.247823  ORF g.247823 m.247823 type:complete len:885 (-) comp15532_c0_seq1:144-2798(-)
MADAMDTESAPGTPREDIFGAPEGAEYVPQTSFSDVRRVLSEGTRPLECSPLVHSSGFLAGLLPDSVLEHGRSSGKFAALLAGRPRVLLSTHEGLVAHVRAALQASDLAAVPAAIPAGELLARSRLIAESRVCIAAPAADDQAAVLLKNLTFLRSFRIDTITADAWTPETAIIAGFSIALELMLSDPDLPLLLLVLPLWARPDHAGFKGPKTDTGPASLEEYTDSIVRGWLRRCVAREGGELPDVFEQEGAPAEQPPADEDAFARRRWRPQPRPRSKKRLGRHKFSYIRAAGPSHVEVMSRARVDLTLTGSTLLSHVIEQLNTIVSDKDVPRRPRLRLQATVQRLTLLHTRPEFRSVEAQLTLKSAAALMTPSPSALLAQGESVENVLFLVWMCSRRNMPTIITLARERMTELSELSLWWNILKGAVVPVPALLGFGGAWWAAILPTVDDKGKKGPNGEKNPDDDDTSEETLLQRLTSDAVRATATPAVLRLLRAATPAIAISHVEQLVGNANTLAGRIHNALQCLRAEHLLHEDLLAHAANAWNHVSACVRLCGHLCFLLGDAARGQALLDSQRRLCNHFAPDIYPWAHVVSCCNRWISGFGMMANERQDTAVVNMRVVKYHTVALPARAPVAPPPAPARGARRAAAAGPADELSHLKPDDIVLVGRLPGTDKFIHASATTKNGDASVSRLFVAPDGADLFVLCAMERAREGKTLSVKLTTSVPERTAELYKSAHENVIRNLSRPMKNYVMRILRTCAALPDKLRVLPSTSFDAYLAVWDAYIARHLPPASPFAVSEADIAAARGSSDRPPCFDMLDLTAPDIFKEIERFTGTEIVRTLCCLSPRGRDVIRFRGVTAYPTAVAMVFAILRGVDDRDYMRRYAA